MNTVQVKNTVIGEGRPKICVPIVGKTKTDILEEAKKITTLPVDVVEWRVDWFDDVFATEKVLETAKELQEVLKDIPVLLTFRTSKEGGEKEISVNDYAALNIAAAQSGYVDLIDVEAFTGDDIVKTIIDAAHEAGVKVIASNHDFFKTPEKEEIIRRLRMMQDSVLIFRKWLLCRPANRMFLHSSLLLWKCLRNMQTARLLPCPWQEQAL